MPRSLTELQRRSPATTNSVWRLSSVVRWCSDCWRAVSDVCPRVRIYARWPPCWQQQWSADPRLRFYARWPPCWEWCTAPQDLRQKAT